MGLSGGKMPLSKDYAYIGGCEKTETGKERAGQNVTWSIIKGHPRVPCSVGAILHSDETEQTLRTTRQA